MQELTPKQEMFCLEYLVDFNATQAAIRAGYSALSAANSGYKNLRTEAVNAKLQRLMNERREHAGLDANYVLERLMAIDRLDVADIMDSEGNVLPIAEWPMEWRLSISSVEVAELKSAEAIVKKIKMPDKLKNLELLGKHINVSAFRERMEVTGEGNRTLVINVNSPLAKDNIESLKKALSEQ